jgi:hypothetical protein
MRSEAAILNSRCYILRMSLPWFNVICSIEGPVNDGWTLGKR